MQYKIERTTRETRNTKDGTVYTGLQIQGVWYNCRGDVRSLKDRTVDGEIKGNWIRINAEPASTKQAPGNGRIAWEDYKVMALEAANLAHMIEADIPGDSEKNEPFVDRSAARAAIVNTVMIAFSNGKIAPVKEEGNGMDEDIPF